MTPPAGNAIAGDGHRGPGPGQPDGRVDRNIGAARHDMLEANPVDVRLDFRDVRIIGPDVALGIAASEQILRALITRSGGEVISRDSF